MKSIEEIIEQYQNNILGDRSPFCLKEFLTTGQAYKIWKGFDKDNLAIDHTPIPFTRENVLEKLKKEVEYGFYAALRCRGTSASWQFESVMTLNYVLEEGLENYDADNGYSKYGLPLFKATALKYGFENPIGGDRGDEDKYEEDLEGLY